jgi:hypothetical protein
MFVGSWRNRDRILGYGGGCCEREGVELVGAWDVYCVDDGHMRVRRELDCLKG